MVHFFPRHTVEWHLHEPAAFRRLSLSLAGMAILAGVTLRLYRWLVLSSGSTDSWWVVLGGLVGGIVILLGLATVHLGNYPVHHWIWRAPSFGLLAGVSEAGASAAFLAIGIERVGTDVAHWPNWRYLAEAAIWRDLVAVSVFAVVLAGVVQAVRYALLKRDHRDSTALAIHEEHEKRALADAER